VIAYRATLDVPGELAKFVAELLAAERHRRGNPRGSQRFPQAKREVIDLW
jgi:hypothetical protein